MVTKLTSQKKCLTSTPSIQNYKNLDVSRERPAVVWRVRTAVHKRKVPVRALTRSPELSHPTSSSSLSNRSTACSVPATAAGHEHRPGDLHWTPTERRPSFWASRLRPPDVLRAAAEPASRPSRSRALSAPYCCVIDWSVGSPCGRPLPSGCSARPDPR